AHAGDLQPLGDAAYPHQIDHHDVDRARLEQVTERHDAVVVLAGRDRCGQRVGHACQSREVVVSHDIFQPVQVVGLDHAADFDGLVHAPELVDVAHQVDL